MTSAVSGLKTLPASPIRQPKHMKRLEELFESYQWQGLLSQNLLAQEGYTEFLDFLYESKLIFSMRGYQSSFEGRGEPVSTPFQFQRKNPYFLMLGSWISWEVIREKLTYDPKRKLIVDSEGEIWNYVYPKGLVPQSRYNAIFPIYQLSDSEKRALGKGCHVQIVSSGKTPASQIGNHVGIRLINRQGELYSFGFEIPTDQSNLETNSVFQFLSTYNVKVTSLDFTEFKKFDRKHITTLPITDSQFQQMIERVEQYAQASLRLNFLNQSCVDFVDDLVSIADIRIDKKRESLLQMGLEVIAPMPFVEKVNALSQGTLSLCKRCIPSLIQKLALLAYAIAIFVPSIIANLVKNSLFLLFGASRAGGPLENPTPQDGAPLTHHQTPLAQVSHLFENTSFSDPLKVIQWQFRQKFTHSEDFTGPKIYLGIPTG